MLYTKYHFYSVPILHISYTINVNQLVMSVTMRYSSTSHNEIIFSYFLPVKEGEVIEITACVLKVGRNIAFTEEESRRKSDEKLAARRPHTIVILPKQPTTDGRQAAQY